MNEKQKALRNLRSRIKTAQKHGYSFDALDIYYTAKENKTAKEINAIRGHKLLEMGVSPIKQAEILESYGIEVNRTDILDFLRYEISSYNKNPNLTNKFRQVFNNAIKKYGEDVVTQNIINYGVDKIGDVIDEALRYNQGAYTIEDEQELLENFITIINPRPETLGDKINRYNSYTDVDNPYAYDTTTDYD